LADLPQVSDEGYSTLRLRHQDKTIGTGHQVLQGTFTKREIDGKDNTRLAVEYVVGAFSCLYLYL
jgi:hypothetical protein